MNESTPSPYAQGKKNQNSRISINSMGGMYNSVFSSMLSVDVSEMEMHARGITSIRWCILQARDHEICDDQSQVRGRG